MLHTVCVGRIPGAGETIAGPRLNAIHHSNGGKSTMRKISKKLVVGTAATAIVAAGAGVAFAYWTASGSGTGTGTVKSSNGSLVLKGTIDDALSPGATSAVHFTASNAGSSNLQVGTVKAVVSTDKPACDITWFTIGDTVEDQTIAAGASDVALTGVGSISMSDPSNVNQDACKGAAITLTLSS